MLPPPGLPVAGGSCCRHSQQSRCPRGLPRCPTPCPAKRDVQSAGAFLALGAEKQRQTEKAVGEGRQGPPEGPPGRLGSGSSRRPVGQAAPGAALHPCLPQTDCPRWTGTFWGNLAPRHQGKAGLGTGPWAGGVRVALAGREAPAGAWQELGQDREMGGRAGMCPYLCAPLEVGSREGGRESRRGSPPGSPQHLPSAQAQL